MCFDEREAEVARIQLWRVFRKDDETNLEKHKNNAKEMKIKGEPRLFPAIVAIAVLSPQ